MDKIIKILMERDGDTYEEAKERVEETEFAIQEAIRYDDYLQVDEIMFEYLGLEPDYIMDII